MAATAEQQEDGPPLTELESLQLKANNITDDSLESTRRMIQLCEDVSLNSDIHICINIRVFLLKVKRFRAPFLSFHFPSWRVAVACIAEITKHFLSLPTHTPITNRQPISSNGRLARQQRIYMAFLALFLNAFLLTINLFRYWRRGVAAVSHSSQCHSFPCPSTFLPS